MKSIHGFSDEICALGSTDEGFFEQYGLNGTDTPAYVTDLLTIRSPGGMGFFEEAYTTDSFSPSHIGLGYNDVGAYNKVPLVYGLEGLDMDPSMDGIWSSIKNVGKKIVKAPVKGVKAVGSGVKKLVTGGGGKKKKGGKVLLDNIQAQALDTITKQGGAALKKTALDTITKQVPKGMVSQVSSVIQKQMPSALKAISKTGGQVAMTDEETEIPETAPATEPATEPTKEEGMSTAAKVGIGLVAVAALGGAAWYFTSAKNAGVARRPQARRNAAKRRSH
jgi:hypothetical protein